ncbi:sensor histidine kinase [Paenibacillus sp.]|uniref:sensor histidine kinase n=1 Tax=Paenibacillus sp. TaxID=58172 RepID=UPI002D661774|nr:histidine kinase [Paenibacillus sp.]HZG85423.1 histidine kinase [Paenibacillus sp.]
MNARAWQWATLSLRIKLVFIVLVITLPLIGMLIYNNFYSIHVVRKQVADSYQNSLGLYMNLIDAGLNDASSYMNTLANGYDLVSLNQVSKEEDYQMAKVYLFNKLSKDLALHSTVSSLFVYHAEKHDYFDVFHTRRYSFEERENVQRYVIDLIRESRFPKVIPEERWQYHRIGEHYYLIDLVSASDTYLGAWVRADELIGPLRSMEIGKGGGIILASDEGEPIMDSPLALESIDLREGRNEYYLSGADEKYLIVATPSRRGNVNLLALIPDQHILANLPYLQRIIWFITIGALVVIPAGFYFMRKAFLNPLGRVVYAMRRVRGGEWSRRVDLTKSSEEFTILAESFNSMMDEIERLRVNVFEEQLNKQREELQRLQLQVNPHFFLNSLNIVYNLAKVGNFELIMQMTMALIRHFRFLFRSNTSFMKLREEIEHTRNYLNIQSLRFPGQLTWNVEAPEYLTDVPVPPLIIQSFVENSIKHGFTMEHPIHIHVKVGFEDEEEGANIKIRIADTGQGFHEAVLEELQAGNSVENGSGERTGIWNVQRRLRLLYEDDVSIVFYNDKLTGGAVVEMILPTNPELEEESL